MVVTYSLHETHDVYGEWGTWSYGKENGTFGMSLNGMWASLDGSFFMGVETYEQEVNQSFLDSIKRWRDINRKLRRCRCLK